MSRRFTPIEASWPATPEFMEAAASLVATTHERFLQLLWEGYQALVEELVPIGREMEDVERSITQVLAMCIGNRTGPATFQCVHGWYEQETRMPAPAQPPVYDLAFVYHCNPRLAWPVEAKILQTDAAVAPYVHDVVDQFLTCRYGPFSGSGAMLAYLLRGDAVRTLGNIAAALEVTLHRRTDQGRGRHGCTMHVRTVPVGKPYPVEFLCHHLVMPLGR